MGFKTLPVNVWKDIEDSFMKQTKSHAKVLSTGKKHRTASDTGWLEIAEIYFFSKGRRFGRSYNTPKRNFKIKVIFLAKSQLQIFHCWSKLVCSHCPGTFFVLSKFQKTPFFPFSFWIFILFNNVFNSKFSFRWMHKFHAVWNIQII